ncbi:Multidrug resistance protein, partial [Elasticomyces elasticus]
SCAAYLADYVAAYGGYLVDPAATAQCSFCSYSSTNTFLAAVSSSYALRWRNFGIMWAFIVFNVVAAVGLYWLLRVPKTAKKDKGAKS